MKGEVSMRYQSNGMEFTYEEAVFFKEEFCKVLPESNCELAGQLQKNMDLLRQRNVEALPVVFLAMNENEYLDFCAFIHELQGVERIPVMRPFYGKNGNVIFIIPSHAYFV